jgi:hypothetical protein
MTTTEAAANSVARSIRIPADIDRIVSFLALEEDRSISAQYVHLVRQALHVRKARNAKPDGGPDSTPF